MPTGSCYFLHVFYIAGNQYQTESKRKKLLEDFFGPEESQWAKEAHEGLLEGSSTHQGASGGPSPPRWVLRTSGAPQTASLLYKYPNIPETLGGQGNIDLAAVEYRTTRSIVERSRQMS